jgi:L-cysteine/cystine lyase
MIEWSTTIGEQRLVEHRRHYPALHGRTYLNFGMRGAMPDCALASVRDSLETLQSVGPGSRAASALLEYEGIETRRALGRLVGITEDRVALAESTSSACALAIWGIRWQPGDYALIAPTEPPGTWAALRRAAARFGFGISSCASAIDSKDSDWLSLFTRELCPRTRLVVASHVDWIGGRQLALAELVHAVRNGPCPEARILIDGAQAVGAIAVDPSADGVDMYAFGGQKWLGGPDGVAALIVSRGAQLDLEPTLVGWRGIEPTLDGGDIQAVDAARRYESGTAAFAMWAGLRSAIAFQDRFAPLPTRARRIAELNARLRAGLGELSENGKSGRLVVLGAHNGTGITAFRIADKQPAAVVRRLESLGIVVREHRVERCIRVCTHYLTLEEEIDHFCEVLADELGISRPGSRSIRLVR